MTKYETLFEDTPSARKTKEEPNVIPTVNSWEIVPDRTAVSNHRFRKQMSNYQTHFFTKSPSTGRAVARRRRPAAFEAKGKASSWLVIRSLNPTRRMLWEQRRPVTEKEGAMLHANNTKRQSACTAA